ncbi:MAG TPA: hypothetical protein VGH48_11035 [Caldimonas sp.]|jgi:hypothetical protein
MQGKMLLGEFSAAYLWEGKTLRFKDPDKGVRCKARIGADKAASR